MATSESTWVLATLRAVFRRCGDGLEPVIGQIEATQADGAGDTGRPDPGEAAE